ncbi:MAG: 5-formyltetrahydrofolate cyclo-ligase [Bacteroidales bacterium]|nr:5-formyltetrahydrofolate cyclo-ligase [Candidatus Sodaliphilus fimicaballi]
MTKKELRQAIKAQKALISESQKLVEETMTFTRIEQLDVFKRSQNILLYCSLPDGLPTRKTISKWSKDKAIFLPRVNGMELDIVRLSDDLKSNNPYNIDEPTGNAVSPEVLDLIVVPAVALDCNCNRMGRGKGFYDRLLATTGAYNIGVALDCQLVDFVPIEPHDKQLDAVVTAHNIFFNKK